MVSLLTLDARGSEKQHQLRLNMQGEPVSGQLALEGSFDRQQERWRGSLNNTRFDTPVGEWRLSRAIAWITKILYSGSLSGRIAGLIRMRSFVSQGLSKLALAGRRVWCLIALI